MGLTVDKNAGRKRKSLNTLYVSGGQMRARLMV